MTTRAHPLTSAQVLHHGATWLLDAEIGGLSPHTREARKRTLEKLASFLDEHRLPCDRSSLQLFLLSRQPCKPSTLLTTWSILRTYFRWMVAEGYLDESPFSRIPKPICRQDQIQPFTQDQILALLEAAKGWTFPVRNRAIVLLLLDTGMRVSELCALRRLDFDLENRTVVVLGKGRKRRRLPLGQETRRALYAWFREGEIKPEEPAFPTLVSLGAHRAMTRSGVLQLVRELGKRARITNVRCSPHTLRHSCAIRFLQSGGNVFALKEMLGHESLKTVQLYLAIAEADVEAQHRAYSPVDTILPARKGR